MSIQSAKWNTCPLLDSALSAAVHCPKSVLAIKTKDLCVDAICDASGGPAGSCGGLEGQPHSSERQEQ